MATARAYTNIALIKYWGKRDSQQMLPWNSSLSLTLDQFYTETKVTFLPKRSQQQQDEFIFAGVAQPISAKVTRVLSLIRQQADLTNFARIETDNHVPTSAGLASSASAFAALAAAGARAAGLTLDQRQLSILARHGSGSASRSIAGGFVVWHAGHDDQSSYAESLLPRVDFPIVVIAVLVDQRPKKVLSSTGMAQSVLTSPFYQAWVNTAEAGIETMTAAIKARDIPQIGALAEANAMQMHATTLSAVPPFTYFAPLTLRIWELVQAIRIKGLNCYLTLDAGPNPKLICARQDAERVIKALQKDEPQLRYTVCGPGPGVTYIEQTK
ncbi:diphosphomevalonate decarboxylase [Lapidilactobacillus luobeiensis]|uniref:diphosphomevalonate decarboxylase n=1 Tax=Lapidilactobacillus luobeiensis TaxID=2950371 RepID=UPI0021C46239|nr:diphosphomevalonate decarboxylase [Lapidilactobacillus luobeiensis]